MTTAVSKGPKPPLGVVAVLVSGFETVNARLELILLPLALDLFLWLGPHLSLKPLFDQFLEWMRTATNGDMVATRNFELTRPVLQVYADGFNLFYALSTAPLGLPSLIAGRGAVTVPGGEPVVWVVDDALMGLLLWGTFVLIGLLLGAFYLGGIAQQVRDARLNRLVLLRQAWGDWAKLTALCVVALVASVFFGTPLLLVAGLAQWLNPVFGALVFIVIWSGVLWVVFYTGFTVHGILLRRRGLFGALVDSLRVVHANLPSTAGLYLAIFVLTLGLGGIWNLPPDTSWFLLIGLVAHALIATALVASTFVFYQDRYRWWWEMQQARQAQMEKRAKTSS